MNVSELSLVVAKAFSCVHVPIFEGTITSLYFSNSIGLLRFVSKASC